MTWSVKGGVLRTCEEIRKRRAFEKLPENLLRVPECEESESGVELVVVPAPRPAAPVDEPLLPVLVVHAPLLICDRQHIRQILGNRNRRDSELSRIYCELHAPEKLKWEILLRGQLIFHPGF